MLEENGVLQERRYWAWIRIAMNLIYKLLPEKLAYTDDLERSYAAAKQIVIELWSIRSLLEKLSMDITRFDELMPDLRSFRDAIAHIDERVGGQMIVSRKAVSTKAGVAPGCGLVMTSHGYRFNDASYLLGLSMSSDGIFTPFGMARDWIIVNTDQGAVEMQITRRLIEQVEEFISKIERMNPEL